jgi:hypothetical protein
MYWVIVYRVTVNQVTTFPHRHSYVKCRGEGRVERGGGPLWSPGGGAGPMLIISSDNDKRISICHPEQSEGSLAMSNEMLRCTQHDNWCLTLFD